MHACRLVFVYPIGTFILPTAASLNTQPFCLQQVLPALPPFLLPLCTHLLMKTAAWDVMGLRETEQRNLPRPSCSSCRQEKGR